MTASRRLYVLLVVAFAAFCLSWFVPLAVFVGYAIDALLVLVLILDVVQTPASSALTASRQVSERLSIGRQNEVTLEVYSQAPVTLRCCVKDMFPETIESDVLEFQFELAGKNKAVLEYKLLPRMRGAYQFGDICIRFASRYGLFWRQTRISAAREVRVYSDLKALQELSVKLAHASELGDLKVKRRGQGTDFASLREYVSGDDIRAIDWKATARRDRPVVRVYEVEKEQTLMVLLDAGRMMVSDLDGLRRFDHAMNAALSLVLTGLARSDQVGIGIFADRPILYMPPRRGKPYLNRILEAICDIQPRMVEPDYLGALSYFADAHKSRSLMVVLTDLTDPTGSQSLLSGLASLSPRHLPFCVTLRDRQVDQIAAAEMSATAESAYRRAVAVDLIAQRELALSHLVRRGCMVLDSPPQDLSSALVAKYLDIKARGLL